MSYIFPLVFLTVWPVVEEVEYVSVADPERILEQTHVVMPQPVILLNRNDAVAYELLSKMRTLDKKDVLLTAQVTCKLSKELGYDPFLFVALMRVESNFNHLATSPVGAEGLMQVMPPTARWMANKLGIEWPEKHSFDPVLNVRLGMHYLALMNKEFGGRISHALTAYNRGPRATHYILKHNGGRLPTEIAEFYSDKVLERYHVFKQKYEGLDLQ